MVKNWLYWYDNTFQTMWNRSSFTYSLKSIVYIYLRVFLSTKSLQSIFRLFFNTPYIFNNTLIPMDRDVGAEWSLLMILSCQICLHIFLLQNKTLIGINMREVYDGFCLSCYGIWKLCLLVRINTLNIGYKGTQVYTTFPLVFRKKYF